MKLEGGTGLRGVSSNLNITRKPYQVKKQHHINSAHNNTLQEIFQIFFNGTDEASSTDKDIMIPFHVFF